jgi:DNA (cytosine-5)-methyltransferase 1
VTEQPAKRGAYGVQLVRGPFVELAPHPQSCETSEQLLDLVQQWRSEDPQVRLAADLFSGAGGLSLGLERAGFRTALAVDHYSEAVETHRHHFGGLSLDWDLADADRVERVAAVLSEIGVDLIAGGPPCQPFSKAGRSGIRHRVRHGMRDPYDERRDLWRAFLEVVQIVQPPAVLMENVPDMALDREMFILRSMVEELEQLGYSVEERVVDTSVYGVPQFRQRLILVALRQAVAFHWPTPSTRQTRLSEVISDLPEVRGGDRPDGGAEGWWPYDGPRTFFQRWLREGVPPEDDHKIYDHITRPVRPDDEKAFELMDSSTRYSQLPAEYKRYRDDIFDDKYKRLDWDYLSRTITAHIAKDGYWYIHPRENRTITIREAARIQTFPDWFRFAGPPSAAFKQIGNAVPPLLAERLGEAIVSALEVAEPARPSSRALADRLAVWFEGEVPHGLPWLKARTRWQVVSAELLLDRAARMSVSMIWPLIEKWSTPQDTVENREVLLHVARVAPREARAQQVLELAEWLVEHPDALDDVDVEDGVPSTLLPQSVADLAALVVPVADEDTSEEPVLVTKGVIRVAARYEGSEHVEKKNRLTDGRLAVARMIGGGTSARSAHKALIELADTICRPEECECERCPLADACAGSLAGERRQNQLPLDYSSPRSQTTSGA